MFIFRSTPSRFLTLILIAFTSKLSIAESSESIQITAPTSQPVIQQGLPIQKTSSLSIRKERSSLSRFGMFFTGSFGVQFHQASPLGEAGEQTQTLSRLPRLSQDIFQGGLGLSLYIIDACQRNHSGSCVDIAIRLLGIGGYQDKRDMPTVTALGQFVSNIYFGSQRRIAMITMLDAGYQRIFAPSLDIQLSTLADGYRLYPEYADLYVLGGSIGAMFNLGSNQQPFRFALSLLVRGAFVGSEFGITAPVELHIRF